MTVDDAAALIETGRAQGQARALAEVSRRLNTAVGAEKVAAFAAELEDLAKRAAETADEYSKASEDLLRDMEHPGARLARRVLLTARAARAAWRASR